MWGHREHERTHFLDPALDLIEQAIQSGVGRFILASTVAIGAPSRHGSPVDDFSPTRATGFWPHLDRLVDLDTAMRENSHRGTQMVTMRLGHFVGAGNQVGIVAALTPRLRTRLVPWIAGGGSRLPLAADTDLGQAFALAAVADGLDDFESFNICGPDFPTARDVIGFIAAETGFPQPWYSVPRPAAHAFGWLMERLNPVLPGSSPFLTRSLVHVAGDWFCSGDYAAKKLGYIPRKDWRTAVREALTELKGDGYPWPLLAQHG
jgi:nucleoside-diphosphate-sugar epimerase